MAEQELLLMRDSIISGKNVTEALQSLNTLLEASPEVSKVQEVAAFFSLPLLFSTLQTTPPSSSSSSSSSSSDEDHTRLASSVLGKVLAALPVSQLAQISEYIELGLQHPSEDVKRMSLNLLMSKQSEQGMEAMIVAPTMFHLVSQLLGDENLQCAKQASAIVLHFASHPHVLSPPVQDSLSLDLGTLMRVNDTVRYRVYELAVQVVLRGGPEAFELINSTGVLEGLIRELDLDDVLVKLNCIQLLVDLLENHDGMRFLESAQVLGKLHSLLLASQQDPLGAVIIPGILKFFGYLSRSEGADLVGVCRLYPEFLQVSFRAVHNPDDPIWGTALDTFGILASSLSGRTLLGECEAQTRAVLHRLGEFLVSASSDIRVRTLGVLQWLVSCKEEVASWEESVSLKWFNTLQPNMFSVLFGIVKQPFKDLYTPALKVVASMAAWEWGQREMLSQAGFLEYLLDRQSQIDKEGKELKYSIVHTLVSSDTAEALFGAVDFLKLRKYEREGPFYYSVDTSVAMEEGSS